MHIQDWRDYAYSGNMHMYVRRDYAYFRNMHIWERLDYAYHRNIAYSDEYRIWHIVSLYSTLGTTSTPCVQIDVRLRVRRTS